MIEIGMIKTGFAIATFLRSFEIWILVFGFVSDFEIRISNFLPSLALGTWPLELLFLLRFRIRIRPPSILSWRFAGQPFEDDAHVFGMAIAGQRRDL